jgi:membrane protein insertase Oxa1/YidC/SpoIIIJ
MDTAENLDFVEVHVSGILRQHCGGQSEDRKEEADSLLSQISSAFPYCSFWRCFLRLVSAPLLSVVSAITAPCCLWELSWCVRSRGVMLRRGVNVLSVSVARQGVRPANASLKSARYISSTRMLQTNDPAAPANDLPAVTEVVEAAAVPVIDKLPELGYYPHDLVSTALDNLHHVTGMPYWQAIIVGTVAVRLLLFPSSVMGLRASSRIAVIRPEVDILTKRAEKDPANKPLYDAEIAHLHKHYGVSYFAGFVQPMIQLPVFLSTFFGLKQMGTYFPDFATGGALWFTNLSIADPTYALPVMSAASFLLLAELGSDDVKMQNFPWFKTVMRVMSLSMVPMTYFLPSVQPSLSPPPASPSPLLSSDDVSTGRLHLLVHQQHPQSRPNTHSEAPLRVWLFRNLASASQRPRPQDHRQPSQEDLQGKPLSPPLSLCLSLLSSACAEFLL